MGEHVKVGASVPAGIDGCRLLTELKLGNFLLTLLPTDKQEALAVAEYCKRNGIYFLFSEIQYRDTNDLGWSARRKMPREEFYSKQELDGICAAGGEYYLGRMVIGEAGGMLYWPKEYTLNRRIDVWEALPPVQKVDEACDAYVSKLKDIIDYEREELGGGPLWDVDGGCTFKYHLQAGIDCLLLEEMVGDTTLMAAALRGAARAYGKSWAAHVAMACYGGVALDAFWLKRFKISLLFDFISGCNLIYPESGHFTYVQGDEIYAFSSPEMVSARKILREFNQFARIHSRPTGGPRVKLGFVYGNMDGFPGLWNKYVWGQYGADKWLFGSAEQSWELLNDVFRKGRWDDENIQGETDFGGNPPFGQYDVVPIEAPAEALNEYSALVFLGWNTMTEEIYAKLEAYVEQGGHLFMSIPHFNTETDRAGELRLFRDGDLRALFGVSVKGKGKSEVAGIKTFNQSTLPEYRLPVWRINTDPRFIEQRELAEVEVDGAVVLSGWSDYYLETVEEVSSHPVLTEYSLGKGKAFLLCSWDFPGERGWATYVKDLLRIISDGEQGDIRLTGSDRVRYAVYQGSLPGSGKRINVIYLLNTEYDTPHLIDLWIGGRICRRIQVEPAEMNVIYSSGNIVLAPEDRGVEIESWDDDGSRYDIGLFSRNDTGIRLFNLSDKPVIVTLNGMVKHIMPCADLEITLPRHIDPDYPEIYAEDFLEEPCLQYLQRPASGADGMDWTGDLPY